MLDSETKRRIDSARDTLVGKVPDPKSQVEQITIALIYKFMDDMDAEAEELGGQRGYFAGDFARFGWAKLLSPALGGFEMLALYGEAIESMTRNPGVPQLFRDIFKNAYLPYRDPETLRMFLKIINDFNYDHSEKLGDAFEYLLSVLGSQGDAGQFRTPRHIIDFMVKLLDPQKDESILDPACGTAGFLISAYKHVLAANSGTSPLPSLQDTSPISQFRNGGGRVGAGLKPEERKKLAANIRGYDISPDMVRLSLANLYLHGFATPNIFEYDTLSSEERWADTADVILANPPFMSPKGGIKPHKRFSVQSNRSEVLFVDYMAEHLNINGRAAIIVPEGIIFQSAGAYKQLRRYLIEHNYLWAVVSLPAGVFNPYAGVKTSILLLDRALAKKTDQILFVKIEKDGYDLGAQRRPLCNDQGDKPELCPKHSDLPAALTLLHDWRDAILAGARTAARGNPQRPGADFHEPENSLPVGDTPAHIDDSLPPSVGAGFIPALDRAENIHRMDDSPARGDHKGRTLPTNALAVSITRLAENGDYNLSADRYREVVRVGKQIWPMVKLGDVCIFEYGKPLKAENRVNGEYPVFGSNGIVGYHNEFLVEAPFLVVGRKGSAGEVHCSYKNGTPIDTTFYVKLESEDKITLQYLFHVLKSVNLQKVNTQAGVPGLNRNDAYSIEIPLPPLETQRQIVDEIAAHQRIIDGARQVVDGWKPDFEISPDWNIVRLNTVCDIQRGKFSFRPRNEPRFYGGKYPFIQTGDIVRANGGKISFTQTLNEDGLSVSKLFEPPIVVITIAANIGDTAVLDFPACFPDSVVGLIPNPQITPYFLELIMQTKKQYLNNIAPQAAQKNINIEILKVVEIPLPPLEVQREIVERIEAERAIVEGNRRLIELYEEKIKKVIARVWEG